MCQEFWPLIISDYKYKNQMLLERDHYALINHFITALTSSVNFTRKYELSGSNNKFFILLNNFKMKTWSELLFCQYLWFSLYLLIKHSKTKLEIISVDEVNTISYLWDQHDHELLKYLLFSRSTCQSNLITKAICSNL